MARSWTSVVKIPSGGDMNNICLPPLLRHNSAEGHSGEPMRLLRSLQSTDEGSSSGVWKLLSQQAAPEKPYSALQELCKSIAMDLGSPLSVFPGQYM